MASLTVTLKYPSVYNSNSEGTVILLFAYAYVYVCECICAMEYMWRLEYNSGDMEGMALA